MAHNRDIPIAFTFRSERRFWEKCLFFPSEASVPRDGLRDLITSIPLPSPLVLLPSTPLPPPIPGLQAFGSGVDVRVCRGTPLYLSLLNADDYRVYSRDLSAYIETAFELRDEEKQVPDSMSYLLVAFPKEGLLTRERDPWKMRDDFMELQESNSALLRFLNRWGRWDHSGGGLTPIRDLSQRAFGRINSKAQPEAVLPFLVWKRRRELRAGMMGSADAWLAEHATLGTTERRSQYPYIGVVDTTCLKAIETTITLDHLRRAKWRICGRPDCNNIFEVESQHGKTYCKQYCAHLVSVRRTRAAAKKANKSTKRKGA